MGIYHRVVLECFDSAGVIKSSFEMTDAVAYLLKSPGTDFATIQHLMKSPEDLEQISSKDGDWRLRIYTWCTLNNSNSEACYPVYNVVVKQADIVEQALVTKDF